MPLNYDQDKHAQELETVLDDYTSWFISIVNALFYPPDSRESKEEEIRTPQSFEPWVKHSLTNNVISAALLSNIGHLQHDFVQQAKALLKEAKKTLKSPEPGEFQKLSVLYEEFIRSLRRLEKEALMEDIGLDPLTGLRTQEVMERDISREMDRLARQGKTFALALVRIDHFDTMQNEMSAPEIDERIRGVGDLVKKSMRSFDDAYRLEDGIFVLSLKQTGTNGGIRALKRLKIELDKAQITYRSSGKSVPLTLSSCIGEPHEGEEIIQFIENLKQDLETYQQADGSVLEHFELSPLQRYIREKDRGRG